MTDRTSQPDTADCDAPPKMTAIDGGVEDGITWAIVRAPMWGAVNGYVRLPDGHPWIGVDYDNLEPYPSVNGGVTFARDGWIGFDTLHAGDYWPEASHYCRTEPPGCGCTVWTEALVAEEARDLARQVARVTTPGDPVFEKALAEVREDYREALDRLSDDTPTTPVVGDA